MQLIKALTAQILAIILVLILHIAIPVFASNLTLVILLQAIFAASLSKVFSQPVWWRYIHIAFMPAIAALLMVNLPSWLYLLAFLLLGLVFWGTFKGDVPLFLSSSLVGEALVKLIIRENAASFADIGAGVGSVVMPLAKQAPKLSIVAMERAPLPWLMTFWRCRHLVNVNVKYTSFWNCNLAEYAVVFAFLSPLVMARLGEKIRSEMQSGSLFISSTFPLPDWQPESIMLLHDRQKTHLYCYRL